MVILKQSLDKIEIKLSEKLYDREVILKASYWLLSKHSVIIDWQEDSNAYLITIVPKGDPYTEEMISNVISKLKSDLIDYATRQIITQQTQHIRTILLAKAFSNEGL